MREPPRFRVRGTWWFGSRRFWIVYGDIESEGIASGGTESGELRPGMTAMSVDGHPFTALIDRFEWMLVSASAGNEHLALVFRPRSRRELDAWRAQAWEDRLIRIATDGILRPCPCCGFRTLRDPERGSDERCGICDWEDDGVQSRDPDYRGGADGNSLNEHRRAFAARYNEEFR